MIPPASPIDDTILLNFVWQGPHVFGGGWSNGGLSVQSVELLFKERINTIVSVELPEGLQSDAPQQLDFTCRNYHPIPIEIAGCKVKPLREEIHSKMLKATIRKVDSLTIGIGLLTKSPAENNKGEQPYKKCVVRSEINISLIKPKQLETGKTYCLKITSSNCVSFSARLLEESIGSPTPSEDETCQSSPASAFLTNECTSL